MCQSWGRPKRVFFALYIFCISSFFCPFTDIVLRRGKNEIGLRIFTVHSKIWNFPDFRQKCAGQRWPGWHSSIKNQNFALLYKDPPCLDVYGHYRGAFSHTIDTLNSIGCEDQPGQCWMIKGFNVFLRVRWYICIFSGAFSVKLPSTVLCRIVETRTARVVLRIFSFGEYHDKETTLGNSDFRVYVFAIFVFSCECHRVCLFLGFFFVTEEGMTAVNVSCTNVEGRTRSCFSCG